MGRKRKAKITPAKQAFRKEQRRIKSFIKRAEKRGYSFPTFSIPKEPSRVTKKQLEQIKTIKPETLYREALYISRETGEAISGLERRAEERKASAAKSARTRAQKKRKGEPPQRTEQILSWVEARISDYEEQYSTKKRWTKGHVDITHYGFDLARFYESALAEYGRTEVAKRFEAHPELKEYADVVFADSKEEAVRLAYNQFMSVLTGGATTMEEAQEFEEDSDYNDDY